LSECGEALDRVSRRHDPDLGALAFPGDLPTPRQKLKPGKTRSARLAVERARQA